VAMASALANSSRAILILKEREVGITKKAIKSAIASARAIELSSLQLPALHLSILKTVLQK